MGIATASSIQRVQPLSCPSALVHRTHTLILVIWNAVKAQIIAIAQFFLRVIHNYQQKLPPSAGVEGYQSRCQEIATFLTGRPKRYVIDDNLNVIEKRGISWGLLALMQPFYRFLGIDVYSHVRIHNVANKLLSFCENRRQEISQTPIHFQMIKQEIFDRMNERTHQKYREQIGQVTARIQSLAPPLPADYLPEISWPEDPATMGITPEEKRTLQTSFGEIQQKIRTNPHRYTVRFSKTGGLQGRERQLILTDHWRWRGYNERDTDRYSVPLSLRLSSDIHHPFRNVVLLSKKVVGRGGETDVRLCYDLSSRVAFVRKKCLDPFVQGLYRIFAPRADRGIVPIREVSPPEVQEALFEKNLIEMLTNNECNTTATKLSLIEDLLHGLSAIHTSHHAGISYRDPASYGEQSTGPFNLFHCDLKPQNIIVKKVDGCWRAAITDFGMANPSIFGGTPGYKSPERVVFESENNPNRPRYLSPSLNNPNLFPHLLFPYLPSLRILDPFRRRAPASILPRVNFKLSNGQPDDMWALAMVFAMILAGRQSERGPFPPLECVAESTVREILERTNPERLRGTFFYHITQEKLNQDLNLLRAQSLQQCPQNERATMERLWDLVSSMARVRPATRIHADQALRIFGDIKSRWQPQQN